MKYYYLMTEDGDGYPSVMYISTNKKDVEKAHNEITNNYINNFNYSKKSAEKQSWIISKDISSGCIFDYDWFDI